MNRSIPTLLGFILICFFTTTSFGAIHPPTESSVTNLAELFNQRFSYMQGIAAYKWANQKPIEEPRGDKKTTALSLSKADSLGLDETSTKALVTLQLSIEKDLQQQWFDEWKANGFDEELEYEPYPDLKPQLYDLEFEILTMIKELRLWTLSNLELSTYKVTFLNALADSGLDNKQKGLIWEKVAAITGK